MEKFTIEIHTSNTQGVLNRITGLYSKLCYNINSLSYLNDSEQSVIRVESNGNEHAKTQVIRQLAKLYEVKEVKIN